MKKISTKFILLTVCTIFAISQASAKNIDYVVEDSMLNNYMLGAVEIEEISLNEICELECVSDEDLTDTYTNFAMKDDEYNDIINDIVANLSVKDMLKKERKFNLVKAFTNLFATKNLVAKI